ncbi:MAG: alpha/beta hydrolase [Bacteroidota bacterium]
MKHHQPFQILLASVTVLLFTGCLRLDFTLFNPNHEITEYRFDDWEGDWNFTLDASQDIPDSLIHVFTVPSQTADETEPTNIYASYIGDLDRIATDTVILYMHGNSWHMDAYWPRVKLLANLGGKNRFGIMEMDYRGYGLSEGTPSEAGMYADVQACIDWLEARGLTGDRLAMYGFSLGTAPATELTANPSSLTPKWLLLEAPFASSEVMAQDGSGLAFPGSFFTNIKIDNAEEIKKVDQPFFWIHGIADEFLDFENHGEVVWKNYSGVRGVDVRVPEADHGDVPLIMGLEAYSQAVLEFLLSE